MIDVYFWPTGNGKKVIILLEEAGIPYRIKPVNIGKGDQFEPDFLKIAPNNRMPAIVDDEPIGGGAPISIFESGAIMMYLAEKSGKFWPQEPHKKYEVAQWCYWQTGNQGPKMGEQGNFTRAAQNPANGDLHYALNRFNNEVHRLYGVMNLGLYNKRYLAAGEYTIADMICYPWSVNHKMRNIDIDEFPNVKRWLAAGQYTIADMICYPWASSWETRDIDIEEFPNVKRWLEEIGERPAVKKAMALGPEFREDPASISAEEQARRQKIVADQRAQPVPKEWIAAAAE